MSARQKENVTKYVIMAIVSLLVLFPYYWMVCTSLKTPSKIFVTPPQWWPDPVKWANYTDLFTRSHLGTYLWNSFKVASLTTVGTVAVAALAAYGLAKIRFPGRNFFFLLFLSAMMLPVEVLTVPTFLGLARFHLTDSHFALIVPQIFGMGGAFGIFMMRQYFITVPDELIEAAKIDGCAQPRIFVAGDLHLFQCLERLFFASDLPEQQREIHFDPGPVAVQQRGGHYLELRDGGLGHQHPAAAHRVLLCTEKIHRKPGNVRY